MRLLLLLSCTLVSKFLGLLKALDGLEHEGGVSTLVEGIFADVRLSCNVHNTPLKQGDLLSTALRRTPLLSPSLFGWLVRVLAP